MADIRCATRWARQADGSPPRGSLRCFAYLVFRSDDHRRRRGRRSIDVPAAVAQAGDACRLHRRSHVRDRFTLFFPDCNLGFSEWPISDARRGGRDRRMDRRRGDRCGALPTWFSDRMSTVGAVGVAALMCLRLWPKLAMRVACIVGVMCAIGSLCFFLTAIWGFQNGRYQMRDAVGATGGWIAAAGIVAVLCLLGF